MRVLVTGGCGFIGSALVRRLLASGHRVLNIDCLAACANASLNRLNTAHYTLLVQDLTTADTVLHEQIADFAPQWAFHLAAETHVDNSIAQPQVSVSNNVLSSLRLLEILRTAAAPLEKLVLVSTDEVYGDCEDFSPAHRFVETDRLQPSSPYSASKAAVDQLALAWHRTFGLPVVISRCCNNFGPWQYPEKLIPKFTARALAGLPLPLYGDGSQRREWLYVEDHVDALLLLAARGLAGEIYNVGSGVNLSNRALVEKLCALLDQLQPAQRPYGDLLAQAQDRPGHDRNYHLDGKKIAALGWQPASDFDHAFEQTVRWMLAHPHFPEPARAAD